MTTTLRCLDPEQLHELGFSHLAVELSRVMTNASPYDMFIRGLALEATGDEEAAAAAYLESWNQGYFKAGDNLSTALLTLGRYGLLEDALVAALGGGVRVPTLRLIATLNRTRGDTELALIGFREAIEAGDMRAYSSMGILHREMGNLNEATSAFEMGARIGDWRAVDGLATALVESDPDRSMNLFGQLASEGHERGIYGLGCVYLRNGQTVLARAAFEDSAWVLPEAATRAISMMAEGDELTLVASVIDEFEESHGTPWAEAERAKYLN